MRPGVFSFVFSFALHALVIMAALIALPKSIPLLEIPESVPIEIVDVSDVSSVIAEAKPKEEPKPEPPAPETASPTPPAAQEEPEPEPTTDEALVPEPEPKVEQPKPEPKPEKPKEQAQEKEESFDLDQIGVLIDKAQKEEKPPAKPAEPTSSGTDEPREKVGAGDQNTITLINLFQRQISRCYTFPAGAVRPEELIVLIDISLAPDGALIGAPEIVDQARMSDPYFRAAAEAAVRAIHQCAPYEMPAEQYDLWKDIRLNFDPRRMLGY